MAMLSSCMTWAASIFTQIAELHRFGGVRILDQGEVVASLERAVCSCTDAPVRCCSSQHDVRRAKLCQLLLQGGLLKG